jgi:predicted neuraminidase
LAGWFSDDGGRTWSDSEFLVRRNEGGYNIMAVSLLRLQNGSIALFYGRKNSLNDSIPMMRISNDEAETWSSSISCITDKEGYFTINNNRVIQMENGRLLVPVGLHELLENGDLNLFGRIFIYYSDDNGNTWSCSEEVPNPPGIMVQEPGVVELKDGRIMMLMRTNKGCQYLSYSNDKGRTWSPIVASNIPSPISPASIVRIPTTGDLLLVWNNNNNDNSPQTWGKRTPLTIAVSKDEGETWGYITDIEIDPNGWYCYTAIHFTQEDILLGYYTGNPLTATNILLLSQSDLY